MPSKSSERQCGGGGKPTKRNRSLKLRTRRKLNEWVTPYNEFELVNSPKDGPIQYVVELWPGQGYAMYGMRVYADHIETALEYVVAFLDKENDNYFFCDDEVYRVQEELEKEGKTETEIEDEIEDFAIYVDATEFGASETHYIWADNLRIRKVEK